MHRSRWHRVLALIAVMAACSSGHSARSAFTAHDSAGISIITSTRSGWTDSTAWQVSADPLIDIGAVQNDPERELFSVAGAVRTADGIAVAYAGTGETRFCSDDGTLPWRVGGRGEGPGEFSALRGLWPCRCDSLLAWDERLRRGSVYPLNGDFARVNLAERSRLNPSSWMVLAPDGRWLGTVEMPRDMLPRDISEDRVVGVARDIHDVEHVRVYRLDRQAGSEVR